MHRNAKRKSEVQRGAALNAADMAVQPQSGGRSWRGTTRSGFVRLGVPMQGPSSFGTPGSNITGFFVSGNRHGAQKP